MNIPDEYTELLARHQRTHPVKVGAIARDLGISVKEIDMSDDISGTLKREDGNWIIRVNRRHSKTRQRFTVAHEIAHFILHRDKIGASISDDTFYRSSLSDSIEREANRLAADILMPWHLVRAAVEKGARDPETLANVFEVSEAAMAIRVGLPA